MSDALSFRLQPFGGAAQQAALGLEHVRLGGRLALERSGAEAILQIDYRLVADLGDRPTAVQAAAPSGQPARRHGLWQHTCLEAFLAHAQGGSTAQPYWELNLAPSGDWALYRFAGYRSGQHAPPLDSLPFAVHRSAAGLQLQLRLPLPAELAAATGLAIGISAVLEQRNGAISHWALHHPGPEADFHRRDGFTLRC